MGLTSCSPLDTPWYPLVMCVQHLDDEAMEALAVLLRGQPMQVSNLRKAVDAQRAAPAAARPTFAGGSVAGAAWAAHASDLGAEAVTELQGAGLTAATANCLVGLGYLQLADLRHLPVGREGRGGEGRGRLSECTHVEVLRDCVSDINITRQTLPSTHAHRAPLRRM